MPSLFAYLGAGAPLFPPRFPCRNEGEYRLPSNAKGNSKAPDAHPVRGSPIRGFSYTKINNRLVARRRGTLTFTSAVALTVRRVVRILTRRSPQH